MAEEEFPNTTHEGFNVTLHTTLVVTTKLVLPTPAKPILPVQTGEQAQQEEQSSGMTIFFSLLVLAICIILVHLLIRYRLHFLPESVAVVSLGILMGAVIKIIEFKKLANWKVKKVTSGGRDVSGVAELESSGAGPCVQAPWAACSVFSPPHPTAITWWMFIPFCSLRGY